VGYQINQYGGFHADANLARNRAIGAFADDSFKRFFYGAHVEARYPVTKTVSPFVFAGGGGATVDQAGSDGLEDLHQAGRHVRRGGELRRAQLESGGGRRAGRRPPRFKPGPRGSSFLA
jgi:hypothetical protein